MKIFAFLLLAAFTAHAAPLPEAARIDEILAKSWTKQGLQPNPAAPDEVFVRRIYLDIAGRIPAIEEAQAFLASRDPNKRMKLIDQLLASDGYVSHFFNYFADILRLQTDTKGRLTGEAYAAWLKEALKKNQPYDSMVRELLTTDGNAWDSGAIGFYMRDQGMPLDHLAATVQIFLGTRIECAQCHNHPFDKWTQMDYYKMAAFTYGMDTKAYGLNLKGQSMDRKMRNSAEGKLLREEMKLVQDSIREVTKSLRYTQIKETAKLPKLPHDYKYDDAKPGDTVAPKTMFGHDAVPSEGESHLDAFAKWMTGPENPRFTTVIANRLWKKVMGMGLIEPVDELTDSTVPSNPELMTYLEELMMQKQFNLKSFLRVLFNSDVYQRMPGTKDVLLGEQYAFTGPLVRRMSAEQIWDSMATLMHGNIDAEAAAGDEASLNKLAALGKLYDQLAAFDIRELIARIKATGGGSTAPKEAKIKELTAQMAELRREGKKEAAAAVSRQINALRKDERDDAFVAVLGEKGAQEFEQSMKVATRKKKSEPTVKASLSRAEIQRIVAEAGDKKAAQKKLEELRKQSRASAGTVSAVTRASDMQSPAPRGHMLRVFGQSDRETIENANREASVPQALNLLNGPLPAALMDPVSNFAKQVGKAPNADAKMDTIYLGLLSRHPTAEERQMLSQVARERGDRAAGDVVHALVNTAEFLFVK